jgi:hypothetical protein
LRAKSETAVKMLQRDQQAFGLGEPDLDLIETRTSNYA